jgi:hypothetical protein
MNAKCMRGALLVGFAISGAACRSPERANSLPDQVRQMWQGWRVTKLGAEDIRQGLASCESSILADYVVFLMTAPEADALVTEVVFRSLRDRDLDGREEVWGIWDRLLAVARMEIPRDDDAQLATMLRLASPLIVLKVARTMLIRGSMAPDFMGRLENMAEGLEKGLLRIPQEDGGFSVEVSQPCLRRIRYALEVLLNEARGVKK